MDETEAGISGFMSGNPKFGQRYRAAFGWRAGSLRAFELESNEAEDSVVLFPSSWCCLNPQLTTLKKKGREDWFFLLKTAKPDGFRLVTSSSSSS
ncbi:hypothetical protein QC763_0089810 [Podospora pseudopauciseta]|uniref:Uncharacterized protein n=1 Tax=Podospora pseudopauciseta TaxID=2093780 RepID=A0ABR0H3X0_9PEZI|nr:hypothetical protein QC763_0089810 [Podospora pseudopauciseta]